MTAIRSTFRCAVAALALAGLAAGASAATPGTRYFVTVPGSDVPLPIAAFSSDARADVGSYSYSGGADARAAHGKFSIHLAGSPFSAGATYASMIVLAQTPAKIVTLTFTNVTVQGADPTSKTDERITFSADDYNVKFSGDGAPGGHTATQ